MSHYQGWNFEGAPPVFRRQPGVIVCTTLTGVSADCLQLAEGSTRSFHLTARESREQNSKYPSAPFRVLERSRVKLPSLVANAYYLTMKKPGRQQWTVLTTQLLVEGDPESTLTEPAQHQVPDSHSQFQFQFQFHGQLSVSGSVSAGLVVHWVASLFLMLWGSYPTPPPSSQRCFFLNTDTTKSHWHRQAEHHMYTDTEATEGG